MKLKTTNAKIKQEILRIFKNQIFAKAKQVAPLIQEEIRQKNLEFWRNSDTYNSLLYGDLNHQIGFYKGTAPSIVDSALEAVSKSIFVVPRKDPKRILTINVFQKDIVQNIGLEIDIEQDESDKLDELDWFHWLTLFGNKYIIWQYEYVDEVTPRSRSGRGIMKYNKDIEGWRIPAEHSGTIDDNWLTRALNENVQLQSVYGSIISKYLLEY